MNQINLYSIKLRSSVIVLQSEDWFSQFKQILCLQGVRFLIPYSKIPLDKSLKYTLQNININNSSKHGKMKWYESVLLKYRLKI